MDAKKNTLIVGGYWTVGRRIAADFAPDYPGRVVVGGRSFEKATQLAGELGYGVRAQRVDVDDPASIAAALWTAGRNRPGLSSGLPLRHSRRQSVGARLIYSPSPIRSSSLKRSAPGLPSPAWRSTLPGWEA